MNTIYKLKYTLLLYHNYVYSPIQSSGVTAALRLFGGDSLEI